MKKRWVAAIAGILFSLGSLTVSMAEPVGPGENSQTATEQETPEYSAAAQETSVGSDAGEGKSEYQWKEDSGGWMYTTEDGKYKKNCWEEIDGYWYHFDRDGYMAVDWVKINGCYYLFRETGDLAIGWCYNDELDKWYYYNPDGTIQKGWFQAEDGSWYWFTTRGEMAAGGYKTIDNKRYYFYDNGKLAANNYVRLYYMDENGQRDKEHDIVIEGKGKESSVSTETKNGITEAMKNVPGGWIKYFADHGWEILYYPDKEYFSAPETGSGRYYVYYKLDTSYRKIKFCKPEGLTAAFGEYIGYAANLYGDDSQYAADIYMNKGDLEAYLDVPDYYSDDMKFYFGKLVEAYLSDEETQISMEEESPEVCETLQTILYSKEKQKIEASDGQDQ